MVDVLPTASFSLNVQSGQFVFNKIGDSAGGEGGLYGMPPTRR